MDQAVNVIFDVKNKHHKSPPHLLQSVTSDVKYIQNCCKNTRTTLHLPQRKLFNSLLYFLTKYSKDNDICLYIGSSPGENISAVAELFPAITFYLYDPKKTKGTNLTNVKILTLPTGEGVKFTHQILQEYIPKKDKILFFSDIRNTDNRGNVTEVIVDSDLDTQLSWIKQLKPKAFCLKFRIPYVDLNKGKTTHKDYIDGYGVLQAYAPETTTEIRLMNVSEDAFHNGEPKMKVWTLNNYENQMFYVNTILREWAYYDDVGDTVLGGDHCFDCALETFFCKTFLDKLKDPRVISKIGSPDVNKLRNWISNYHIKLRLEQPKKPPLQTSPEYRGLKFEQPLQNQHGSLPKRDRNIADFLKVTSPISLLTEVLEQRGRLNLTNRDIYNILTKHTSLIEEAITHKSMNSFKNYERL